MVARSSWLALLLLAMMVGTISCGKMVCIETDEDESTTAAPTTTTMKTTRRTRPTTVATTKRTTILSEPPSTTTTPKPTTTKPVTRRTKSTTVKPTTVKMTRRTTRLTTILSEPPTTTTTPEPTTTKPATTRRTKPTTVKPTTAKMTRRTTRLTTILSEAPTTTTMVTTTTTTGGADICDSYGQPGFYDDPSDCAKFVFCCEDQPTVHLQCAGDEVFDPLKKKCSERSVVAGSCGDKPTVPTFDCTGKRSGFYRDPFKCDTYYYCKRGEGQAFKYMCDDGFAFDTIARECRPEASVQGCLPERDTVSTSFCAEKRTPGLYSHPAKCGEGVICLNDVAFKFTCEGTKKFDAIKMQCDHEAVVKSGCEQLGR